MDRLPNEILHVIFGYAFYELWYTTKKGRRNMRLRLTCKTFNTHIIEHTWRKFRFLFGSSPRERRLHDLTRKASVQMSTDASLRLMIEWIGNECKQNYALDKMETVKVARNALESISRMVGRGECGDGRLVIAPLDNGNPYLYRVCFVVANYLSQVKSRSRRETYEYFIPKAVGTMVTGLPDNDWSLILPIVVWEGDTEFAKELIEKGADVNVDIKYFGLPVHIAARNNDVDMLSLLLDNGASIISEKGVVKRITPLHVAVVRGAKEATELLLERGAPINGRDSCYRTCLEKAISSGHDDIAHALVRRPDLDPNNWNIDECQRHSALIIAISLQKQSIIEALLERGDIDHRGCGHDRHMPLYFATVAGNTKAIDKILERGQPLTNTVPPFYLCHHAIKHGDLDRLRSLLVENRQKISGRAHRTLIFDAVAEGRVDMAKSLLESNDKMNLKDCLLEAASLDDPELMKWALEKYDEHRKSPNRKPPWEECDLNFAIGRAGLNGNHAVLKILLARKDADVNNPQAQLVRIIRWGTTKSARLMLEMRADTNYRDLHHDHYPLNHAIRHGRKKIVELLLRKSDIDVNARTYHGWTSLMLAAREGQVYIVQLLLKRDDVDIDAEDEDGNTALKFAIKEGYHDLAAVLENGKRARNILKNP